MDHLNQYRVESQLCELPVEYSSSLHASTLVCARLGLVPLEHFLSVLGFEELSYINILFSLTL